MAGFAGYKAGMTHVMMIDDRPRSLTEGMEISVPVTVLEVPPMNVIAVRAYENYNGGLRPAGEAWAENLSPDLARALTVPKKTRGNSLGDLQAMEDIVDIRIIAYTNPMLITASEEDPELMEMRFPAPKDRLNFASGLFQASGFHLVVFDLGIVVQLP
jgi:large subunit ribosomal protein L3